MIKKILLTMFVLCMTLIFFPCWVSAEDYPTSGTCGENLTWKLEYIGEGYELVISGMGDMEDYDDNVINTPWWPYMYEVKNVKIETGVMGLGDYAFYDFQNLASISMPSGVKRIGRGAFRSCYHLTDVNIPDSVTSIESEAFYNCFGLTSVSIPSGVTSIGENVFAKCSGLISVSIPGGITNIGSRAFESCSSLTSVIIPNGITNIGSRAFESCSSLTSVIIPNGITKIEENTFANCSSLTNVSIPSNVIRIENMAFFGCNSLTSIIIPNGVKEMIGAFRNCDSLTSVSIPHSVTNISSAFADCDNLISIRIPESVTEMWSAFKNCSRLESVNIPNGVTDMGWETFMNCKSLTSITIPESVTDMGREAFAGCSSLTSINIPKKVTTMGYGTFSNCSSLTSVTIPERVRGIGNYVFSNCSSLTDITIPEGVGSIGDGAFAGCDSLTSINIPDGVTYIGEKAFQNCSGLTRMAIPVGVETMKYYTFMDCSNLRSISIPISVKRIESKVFSGCDSLTDLYYGGNESDWESIDYYSSANNELIGVTIHYNSEWVYSLFQSPSTKYNNRLALIAADMSEKAEEGEDAIRALYESYGISDCECYNFDGSAAFAIGQTALTIDGADATVLVITARGTKNFAETVGDLFKGGEVDFLGKRVWKNVHEFYQKIRDGLDDYIEKYPAIKTKEHLKILVNGHSLGGAAANMVGARLTNDEGISGYMWRQYIGKEDIYVYTFGAIKVLNDLYENKNVSDGYENIHNIYNFYDSYGPNGNWSWTNASAMRAKFGHTELYYLHEDEKLTSCNNHLMSNYKKALEQNMVSCSEKAQAASKARIEKLEKNLSGIWQNIRRMISQIAVLCPVDVEIYASDGSLAGSVVDNEVAELASDKVYICIEGDKKYIYLLDDDDYTIKLKGTDAGTMTYSVQNIDMDTGEVMEEKTFVNVTLTAGKAFAGSVKVKENIATEIATDEIRLFVVKDNGEPEKEVLADGSGTETAVSEKPQEPEKPGTDDGMETPGSSDSTDKQPDEKNPGGGETDKKDFSVKVKKIKISGISKKIAAGKKITLKAAVSPSNAANKSITWKSGNKKYASVNSRGIVTLKKAGAGKTVTITAAAKDDSGKKASYKIKIMKGAVKEVKISGKTVRTAKSGRSVKLKASVKASNGANKALQWKSSNTRYASVNGKGKVTLKKAGKGKMVKITAMATDGSGKKAAVKIKIK
ncbi:MAG: leucine-rich repeat protein [Eubacterium sp.]|nr:leucine-rich repeat protein [Eubacterium sp.]